jgi:hypothetical protein
MDTGLVEGGEVVDAQGLPYKLSNGYRLVLAYEEETSSQTVYNNGLSQSMPSLASYKTVKFVVVRGDKDGLVGSLRARAEKAETTLRDNESAVRVTEKAAEALRVQLEAEKGRLKTTEGYMQEARNSLQREQVLRRKMEDDIAKIRTELGEARMREIIGK